ncbi:GFA family protein [Pseudoalteromonas sp. S16_S37]|uniref:GFA family protein n=1 Tax=Pseudoalteromonas sp. S16_S37 TaxID=2720228 RepID=UPI0016809854|nr:GFA family protein [Pseudoalteromonas sp. S16_S37]MBD1584725.1 GFA family protein [Pseudoalteromonas sp. S16_S37]
MKYQGSCHCGQIRFEVEAPDTIDVERCNCSICKKSGYLHLIVPNTQFKLLSSDEKLKSYSFNTHVARHYFCNTCGIKPFYLPRSNPDGIDVNVNCIDTAIKHINIVDFDGQNWEQHAHKLAHKTKLA